MLARGLMVFVLWGLFVWGTCLVREALSRLAAGRGKVAKVAALVLAALGLSLPALFVVLAAVLKQAPEMALGKLIGANIVNASLIIGVMSLLAGSLPVMGEFVRWELAVAFLAGSAPLILMMDGALSRLDGAILVVIYLIYLRDLFLDWRYRSLSVSRVGRHNLISCLTKVKRAEADGVIVRLVMGTGLLFISAVLLVETLGTWARWWGVSEALMGLLPLALATTVAELLVSLGMVVRKEATLILANLLGSVVTHATLMIGILVLISPLKPVRLFPYAAANIGFVVLFGIFWFMTKTKKKLERWEGLVLTGAYLMFAGLLLFLT